MIGGLTIIRIIRKKTPMSLTQFGVVDRAELGKNYAVLVQHKFRICEVVVGMCQMSLVYNYR